ncbi:helix-turn-helix domain-containing protein [Lactococcus lactis]|uniref:helix-turn-helix domain-containing protein n=1 Tax=Lactococcus lactis TaxID=1358 RepID=UPI00111EEBF9|nr:helix-turn-helix transcriptional regulator [Lactococcus lactis]MDG4970038.1 helix-turn-helix transcriptional regulator [Lactococcus lactis]MDG5103891.1 helix-turn-helix transcriptional regulator [Lactococcus lactis]TNU77570.1 helix-turn-helix transcriptional regulator [Lactococcus lactis subsp. lactis]
MTIKVHIDRLLVERQMTVTELSTRVGITMANISILKNGKAKAIRFSTLEGLCDVLECQPGELLEYIEDKK